MAATASMAIDVSGSHMLFPDGTDAQQLNIQPVFIQRSHASHAAHQQHQQQMQMQGSLGQQQTPGSPSPNQADFSLLLRNVAALCSTGGLDGQVGGSTSSNLHHDLAALRSSPRIHSSPSLLYSPMAASNGPGTSTYFLSSNGMNAGDMLNPDGSFGAAAAASADPQLTLLNSNGNNLAHTLSAAAAAAAAMYGDGSSVQTLYSTNDQMAMTAAAAAAAAGANAARAAQQTQTILQQQAAAAASLGSTLGSFGSLSSLAGPLGTNGLSKLEESLSGSLFGSGSMSKPVSSSLYIKNLPPDADKLFLYEKFSPYGAILSVKVLNDPKSGQCRGVGFINFAEHSSAMRSIQALHGTKAGDKLMHVSLQTPRIRASAVQC